MIPADDLLSPTITGHCFWGWCNHTETGYPNEVHAALERHYETAHRADLDKYASKRWRP